MIFLNVYIKENWELTWNNAGHIPVYLWTVWYVTHVFFVFFLMIRQTKNATGFFILMTVRIFSFFLKKTKLNVQITRAIWNKKQKHYLVFVFASEYYLSRIWKVFAATRRLNNLWENGSWPKFNNKQEGPYEIIQWKNPSRNPKNWVLQLYQSALLTINKAIYRIRIVRSNIHAIFKCLNYY